MSERDILVAVARADIFLRAAGTSLLRVVSIFVPIMLGQIVLWWRFRRRNK